MSDGSHPGNPEPEKVQINRRAFRAIIAHNRRAVRRAGKPKQYHLSREQVAAAYRAKGIIR